MEEETYMEEELETMEEEKPLETCPICSSEITEEQKTTECDWCGLVLHEECESKSEKCPNCKRYLPWAKMKALTADRRHTAILIIFPFAVIEIIIAIYSWLSHPSEVSVPDIHNWFSLGLIVNVILLIIAIATMGAISKRGEGVSKPEPEDSPSEETGEES